jgi:SWI/SNF-related matrix-associated actin-dependent regulator 1 of chromatin subfamily A
MSEELFPYQKEGVKWLSNKKFGLLADEMGLGKSVQTIRATDFLKLKNILIICMAVGRINWQREFEKWSKNAHAFSILREGKDTPLPDSVVITSYDYLTRNTEKLIREWDVVIFDESHSLKNPRSKRARAALGKKGVVRLAKRIWFLSGTPAPNNFSEMWTTLITMGATTLSFDDFAKKYCHVQETEYGPNIRGNKMHMVAEMKELLSNVMLRRKKEKGMLPELLFQLFYVEAGEVDLEMSTDLFRFIFPVDNRAELSEILRKQETLLSMMLENVEEHTGSKQLYTIKTLEGLANSVSTLRRYNGLKKVAQVIEAVSFELEHGDYEKIVIFAIHRDVIEQLRKGLIKFNPVTLYGGKTDEKKQQAVDRFQNDKRVKVFIGNIQAAGTTVNLTKANNVLFVEQDWVPGNNAQAMMRVHRIGQTKPVLVRFATIKDSLDEKIDNILRRKSRELVAIFDDEPEEFDEHSESILTAQAEFRNEKLQIPDPRKIHDAKNHEKTSGLKDSAGANSKERKDDIFS